MKKLSSRNPLPFPQIQHEELYTEPLRLPGYKYDWKQKVDTHNRLYLDHTLASIRCHRMLKAPLIPHDSLDFMLATVYQNGPEVFPEKSDVYRQLETIGVPTWRLLRNVRSGPSNTASVKTIREWYKKHLGIEPNFYKGLTLRPPPFGKTTDLISPYRGHPITYGGLNEKLNPYSVKLANPTHHSAPTKRGYGEEGN